MNQGKSFVPVALAIGLLVPGAPACSRSPAGPSPEKGEAPTAYPTSTSPAAEAAPRATADVEAMPGGDPASSARAEEKPAVGRSEPEPIPPAHGPGKRAPIGTASIGGAAVSHGAISNASAVVAGMAAGFRRCYNKGLQGDPNMKGSVRLTAKIGPNGEVLSVSPSGGSGLSGTVVSCVAARVSAAQFAPPEGGGATLVIPVTFTSE
jgi:hypothetical protein